MIVLAALDKSVVLVFSDELLPERLFATNGDGELGPESELLRVGDVPAVEGTHITLLPSNYRHIK